MIVENKTIVITGVGPGLGTEIATAAARDGANLVLAARTEKKLERIAKQIDPSGERVAFVRTDIGEDVDCERLANEAVGRFGSLDALVQVAALDAVFGNLMNGDLTDFERAFRVNVLGTARVVRSVVPRMQKSGGGSVVLIGTQAAFAPSTPQIAYGASKGALRTAMYYLAKELGPLKIRVNTVVPTWMWGPPVEAYVAMEAKRRDTTTDAIVAEITSRMPLGEIPEDGDVAEAVVFFCSDRARMITGQSLLVNAGEVMP